MFLSADLKSVWLITKWSQVKKTRFSRVVINIFAFNMRFTPSYLCVFLSSPPSTHVVYILKMDQENVVVDCEVVYPILFIPKRCTTLESDCDMSDNVYIDLNITSPDTEGNETRIYSGFCNVKLVDSYDFHTSQAESTKTNSSGSSIDNNDGEQMPNILSEANHMSFPSYNESQVWIDPSRSPYVYNHYDASSQKHYAIRDAGGCITVEQHNTYITQNVYNYKESNVFNYKDPQQSPSSYFEHKKFRKAPETSNQQESNANYYEDEFECGEFQSQLPEEIIIEKQSKPQKECEFVGCQTKNNALKQLMSTDTQKVPKQRKTILFLGNDSNSGQTIQNISYNDPMLKCAELEVDNEVVIQDSSSPLPKKKKYQCDKCKQIFDHISAFNQHMFGNHTNYNTTSNYNTELQDKDVSFVCTECRKKFKDQTKFEIHCLGHGDPDLECPKCHKVYASKFTLRAHQKIHKRKFHCTVCIRSYSTLEDLNTHLSKAHYIHMCKYDGCNYETSAGSELRNHHENHARKELSVTEYGEREQEKDVIVTEEGDLKSEGSEDAEENDAEEDRVREADSVIAKVMSNKIFLLNNENAKKHAKNNKACQVCYKSFDRISDLKRHLIEHVVRSTLAKTPVNRSGGLDIVCEICQTETFAAIDKYKAHLREHAKLTLYKCTFCDKSFSDSSNFSKHKKTHGISYFQCDLCQRKFNTKKMITQHMENHNNIKPVKCRYCPRTFHFQSMLNKHMRGVHKNTIVRFRCRFCDDFFKALKDKWDHEWIIHNVRQRVIDCLTCGAKFRKYLELKRHCLDLHGVNIPKARKFFKKKKVYY